MTRILISFLFVLVAAIAKAQDASSIVFIVNADNPVSSISSNQLKDFYFKHKRTWPDGTSVRFIEAGARSPLRKLFTSKYLDMSVNDADLHWIGQKLYSGDSAPMQQSSESLIVQFVASIKGSIGYVSDPALAKGKSVKVLKVEAQ